MKFIDENGRLFGKVSIIDVVVVLVVAALAVVLSFKQEQTHTGTSIPNDKITFQIQATAVRNYIADAVEVGDLIYDKDYSSGGALGTITDIQVLPALRTTQFHDGTFEIVPVADSVTLLLTVEGEGVLTDGSYLINRVYAIGINSARNYYTKYALFTGIVDSITLN